MLKRDFHQTIWDCSSKGIASIIDLTMSNISADCNLIMTLFKDAADDYAKKNKMTRNNKVSPVFTNALTVMVTNILEREDSIKQDYEEKLNETKNHYEAELSKCKNEISELKAEQRMFLFELDAQAQYNRSENIKIHNVKYSAHEDTNSIIKDLGKYAGVPIKDEDISITHRLVSKDDLQKLTPSSKIPPIIVRFNRRDIKSKLLEARKNIMANTETPLNLKNASLYEDVTPLRSRIMYQLRQRDAKKAFKFVWSKGGRIYARTHAEAEMTTNQPKPRIINNPDDLLKNGFSQSEIDSIIKGDVISH